MKRLLYAIMVLPMLTLLPSCEHVEEEVEINQGHKTHVRIPDPEPLTAEDLAILDAMKAEYEQNAK